MSKFFGKTKLVYLGPIGVAIMPLAVAASCSSDEAAANQPVNATVITNTLKVNSASTHDQVTWPVLPTDKSIESIVFYVSDAPKTETELKNLAPSAWVKTLPQSVDFDAEKRHIWVKVTPTKGFEIANPILDLTTSSNIKSIKSTIDAAPTYSTLDLSQIAITYVSPTDVKVEEFLNLPSGTKVLYDLPMSTGIDKEGLKTYLSTHTLTPTELAQVKAYLAVIDATKYILKNPKRTPVSAVTSFTRLAAIGAADVNLIQTIQARGESLHNNVTWTTPTTSYSSSIARVVFSLQEYADVAAASAAPDSDWVTDLPKVVNYTHQTRQLWAKVISSRGFIIEAPYLNLTSTSGIRNVKSLIDANAGAVNLNQVTATLTTALEYVISEVKLPDGATIGYKVGNEPIRNKAELAAWLNSNKPASASIRNIGVTLINADSTKYQLNNPQSTTLNASKEINAFYDVTESASDLTELTSIKVQSTSDHKNVLWNKSTFSLSTKFSGVKFLAGDYATLSLAKAAPSTAWTNALPTTVDLNRAKRFIWAKLTPAAGVAILDPYFNLTPSSEVQAVKALIDAATDLATLNLRQVYLIGSRKKVIIDESRITPSPLVKLVYSYKTLTGLSSAELVSQMAKDSATLTLVDVQAIKVGIAPIDPLYYVLKNNRDVAITTNGEGNIDLSFSLEGNEIVDVTEFSNSIRVQPGGHDSVAWWVFDQRSTIVPTLPKGVQKIEFVIGNYPLREAAEAAYPTAKRTSLPNVVDVIYQNRFLWAFYTLAPGYSMMGGNVVDLTSSSKIRDLTGYINRTPEYLSLFSSRGSWTIRGPMATPVVDFNGNAVPSLISVKYWAFVSRAQSPIFDTLLELIAWLRGQGYDTAAKINSNSEITFYVRFGPKDPAKYTVNREDFKYVEIGIEGGKLLTA